MKKRIMVAIVLMIAILFTGCSRLKTQGEEGPINEEDISFEKIDYMEDITPSNEDNRQTTLYYKDGGGYIVPVVRNIPRVEGIAKAALSAMVDNYENRIDLSVLGLQPVLPSGTEVELNVKDDGLMRANFSNEILKVESKAEEESMVSAIIYTLTEFENVDNVQIMVENNIIETLTYGTDVSQPLNRGNINPLDNEIEGEHSKMTLYMYNNPTGEYTYFVPVTKNVPVNARNIETAIQELVETEGQVENLQFNIPKGTKVHGVSIESGIAYVNFSEHLGELQDLEEMNNLTKAIALTLKEFGDIQGVQILIDGEATGLTGNETAMPTFSNTY